MRRSVMIKSVQRLLRNDEELLDAAFMWNRHRLMIPYAALAFGAMLLVALIAGFDTWASRLGLAAAGAGVAAMATTNYRILAHTDRGFVLLRASRVRQYATEILERWPHSIELTPMSSFMVVTDWTVHDRRYSVPKSSEQSVVRMAAST